MAGRSLNSFGSKNFAPGPPATRYNASGKNREFYTYENAPGIGAYATGGTIIDGGDGYIYHIFTGTGTFAVNRPSAAIDSVDYLIVAGGGCGGGSGGGGGGGGCSFGNIGVSNAPGSYAITVGGGGGNPGGVPSTRNGSPSSALGVTATGGGGGGADVSPAPLYYGGSPGGSGGGAYGYPPVSGGFGVGNTPGTIPRQGYPGAPQPGPTGAGRGSGGGGAGGLGFSNPVPLPAPTNGTGGPGRIFNEFPAQIVSKAVSNIPTWYSEVNTNGFARGGYGNASNPSPNTPANTGHGGPSSTSGGSGIVCIRYKKTAPYSRATGGTIEPNTHPEHPGVFRHIFTSPGDFTVTDPTLQYIEYLAVAGGGGGASPNGPTVGGGGGAGGFVSSIHTSTTTPTSIPEAYPWNPGYSVQVGEQYPVGVGTYPIGIGTGGNAATVGNNTTIGNPGGTQIIAAGGGIGGSQSPSLPATGGSGGSGGGSFSTGLPVVPGGTATPSPVIQGNSGGNGGPSPAATGGGGGGAGAAGASSPGLTGGVGWYSVLSPSSYGTPGPLTPNPLYRYFAGGGGGSPSSKSGGAGGGGPTQTAGTTNTGGGGGGAGPAGSGAGGAGGPGIVIIQYPE